MEDRESLFKDKFLDMKGEGMPGLTLDIFPFVSCEVQTCKRKINKIQKKAMVLKKICTIINVRNKWMMVGKSRIQSFLSQIATRIIDKIIEIQGTIKPGSFYIIPVDPNYSNRYFPKTWFYPLKRHKFEEKDFYGANDYDSYLKVLYCNYMVLPPVEKRRNHCDNVFAR